ncbi:MAG TPA: hypothetical protein VHK24_00175, partial [Steroidobacter sp.]|nr:hypothetical protein [Steroidobacter sp.]
RDGSPVHAEIGPQDRYQQFTFSGIAADISTMIVRPTSPLVATRCEGGDCPPACEGENCPAEPNAQLVCLAGVRVLDICRDFDARIKTYWRESTAD